MQSREWKLDFETELQRAEDARRMGNEGQARVCARRAAGTAIRQYFLRASVPIEGLSAFDLIVFLQERPGPPKTVREILTHLTQRVEPGGILPLPVDLIAETRLLPQLLGLEDETPSNPVKG